MYTPEKPYNDIVRENLQKYMRQAVRYGENRNAVLKKVYRQNDGIMLMACNDAYKPIFTDDFLVVGELIGTYHPR